MSISIPVNGTSVSIALTLICSIALGTYTLGKDTNSGEVAELKHKLSSYEKANSMNLPKLIENLSNTSEKLALNANEKRLLNESKETVAKLSQKLKEQTSKLSSALALVDNVKTKNSDLEKKLLSYEVQNKTFTVFRRETHELVKGGVVLGVKYISMGSAYADLNLGNEKHRLEVGNSVPVTIKTNSCSVTLLNVSYNDSAEFRLTCQKS
ncbi:hypothetical protein [Enterovibrio norvegicus]|uniref:hypothetical protein n=1 Tax=Enterovibrio norvegicus TaxID=188144 RepID=UPI000C861EF7|nr:hypothetical protein [Enterovibrio norvegicus]PML81994.1 hypothetical protein BCT69_01235 [Enterovibrio norvegicus]